MKKPTDNPFPQWSKPSDIIDSIQNPLCREFVIAINSQMGLTSPDARPEWANRSAMEFWRAMFGQYPTKECYGWGYFLGTHSLLLDENDTIGTTSAIEVMNKIILIAANENSPEAADFFHGYGDGRIEAKTITLANALEILQPKHTWKIYMIIAFAWRACVGLTTARQWRDWLVSIEILKPGLPDEKNEKLDSEINSLRNLLRRIGVPLKDRGGRPKVKTHIRQKTRRVG